MRTTSYLRPMRVVVLSAAAAFIGWGCRSHLMSLAVPLTPYGSDSVARSVSAVPANPHLKLYIEVSDTRPDVNKIGENREEDSLGARPVKSSGSTPAEFIRDLLGREFTRVGMTVVIDRAQANRVLHLSITRFFVIETGTYQADIALAADVSEPSGKRLWTGNVNGENATFGRSMNPENYQQVLTAATVEVAEHLCNNAEFPRALQVP